MIANRHTDAIEHELHRTCTTTLSVIARHMEDALDALDALDPASTRRAEAIDEAATAVWHYMILHESFGFYDHEAALAIYRVPPAVMAQVGVLKRRH